MGSASAPRGSVSLGVLLQQGLPEWCEAVRTASGPATRVVPPSAHSVAAITGVARELSRTPFDGDRSTLIAANQHGDIVTLLAGLVLSASQTRYEPALSSGGPV